MNTEDKKFFIGLDIGTESVGYAGTDEKYNVLSYAGKQVMGARLFPEAQTAAGRRVFRATKVRKERTKYRLGLLQKLFWSEIEKTDPLFFIRMQASSFWADDKLKTHAGLTTVDSLFADSDYTDKAYFHFSNQAQSKGAEFKTIYHWRSYLFKEENWMNNTPDIRLVYLACHHILKYRGHFLLECDEFNIADEGKSLFEKLNQYLLSESENSAEEEALDLLQFNLDNFKEVENISQNSGMKFKVKEEQLQKTFCIEKNKRAQGIVKTFLGGNTKITDIFPFYKDAEEFNKYTLNGNWEELAPQLAAALDDDFKLVEILKEIYDWFTLSGLLKGKTSISEAMLDRFAKHNSDLCSLKKLVRDNAKQKYYKIFRSAKEKHNYAAYIGSTLVNGKTIIPQCVTPKDKCTQENFYKFLKNELSGILTEEMLLDIENGQFLQKLRSKDNATIPYQLHKMELKGILQNASKVYNIDSEKILSLLSFRVPYFVGRLNTFYKDKNDNSHHVWVEKYKNERTKITPWNIKEIVDYDKSAENFIERMLSKCSYLQNKTVLPQNSLDFSKFKVLNELNNLKIKDEPISVACKQRIYEELFTKYKQVSFSKLLNLLGELYPDIQKSDISGVNKEKSGFIASLNSYIYFEKRFKNTINDKAIHSIIENVILWQALFNDKKQVENKIIKEYPQLSPEIVAGLKAFTSSGFGSLSREFLKSPSVVRVDTGEVTSILDLLWSTNENLMQLIHNKNYNIQDWIARENKTEENEFTYQNNVATTYASPSVKRAAWQAMLVVDELIEIVGKQPDKIFVEVIRSGKADKKTTDSRRKKLFEKWGGIKDFNKVYAQLKDELEGMSDDKLRGDKLYLYFLQCGKCAYSGDTINISDLANDNLYDIDHIIPQALKKDDSLTNKVLAKKVLNGKKDKNYPLCKTNEIWARKDTLLSMWEAWKKCGLISDEKFQRLKRTSEISDKELEGFIARQLVFTGQATTVVADLLKQKYKESDIIYSKAENVSDFRKKFDLLKCRDINDLHHAEDAYLNIVVGNTFDQRFNRDKNFYVKKYEKTNENWKVHSQSHLFEYNIDGAWEVSKTAEAKKDWIEGETIQKVKKQLLRKSSQISKKTIEQKGGFYKQTVYSATAHQKKKKREEILPDADNTLIPRKGEQNILSQVEKYGGYKGLATAYFMIIEYTVRGKRQREFVPISILHKKEWEGMTQEEKISELSQKYTAPKIICPKILIGTLFHIGNIECRLAGRTGDVVIFHNAKQWYADKECTDYIRIISKYNEKVKTKKLNPEVYIVSSEIEISGGDKFNSKIQKLTKDGNQKLWNAIVEKIRKLYGNFPKELKGKSLGLPDITDKLDKCASIFPELEITAQIEVLSGLIAGLGCNPYAFNLSAFELNKKKNKSVGAIIPHVKIKYPLIMVNQSVTGLKEKRIPIYPFRED